MKKNMFLIFALIALMSCGKKEIAALTQVNQELTEKNQELMVQVEKSQTAEKNCSASVLKLQQELSDSKNELKISMKDTVKLEFIKKQLEGIKAVIVTNLGSMEVEFYPELAPIHCFNFITRAESGYFNGTQFHRVIPGFMIQGGDPNSRDEDFSDDGQGGPIVSIPHEFNSADHVRGVLSMARVSNPRLGAGSQFFIIHQRSPHLNNKYTVFGKVINGLDVIDKITSVKRNKKDHPIEPVRILSVETYR